MTWHPRTRGGIIAKAAAEVAERVGAPYLIAFTQSGDSARRLARLRGEIPVLAFTPHASTRSRLALTWGVEAFKTEDVEHTDEMVRQVDEALLEIGRLEVGEQVVIIGGSPPGIPGLDERPADPPDRRRDQRRGSGLPADCATAECPGWDSNPHWTVFETASSTGWDTGATGRQRTGPAGSLPASGEG